MKIQYIVAPHAAKYHGRKILASGGSVPWPIPQDGERRVQYLWRLNLPSLNRRRRRDRRGRHRHHQGYDL
jgi:hypothetical protein